MSDAPERIVLATDEDLAPSGVLVSCVSVPSIGKEGVEYIRADIEQWKDTKADNQRLRKENARLREALEKICDRTDDVDELWVIAHDALEADHE